MHIYHSALRLIHSHLSICHQAFGTLKKLLLRDKYFLTIVLLLNIFHTDSIFISDEGQEV